MTAVTALKLSARPRRIDPMAAAWGGLVGGLGLVIAGPRELTIRIMIVVIAGVISGFLTGVRAIRHRIANAFAAWVVANLFYFAFVIAASIVHWLTGRQHAPAFLPGGIQRWLTITLVGLIATLIGGGIANTLLRPASRRSNYS
jgi:hypothetical protein